MSHSVATHRLEQTLPFIEQHHLSAYRNQDWCKNIAYTRGAFSSISVSQGMEQDCNYNLASPAQPFDNYAEADFAHTRDTLASTTLLIRKLHAEFDMQGRVYFVEFKIERLAC